MINTNLYIYKKEIDWSALHLGVNIPVSLQNVFYENIKIKLKKGESKKIKLLLNGMECLLHGAAFVRVMYKRFLHGAALVRVMYKRFLKNRKEKDHFLFSSIFFIRLHVLRFGEQSIFDV
jgi:hypothetical protein